MMTYLSKDWTFANRQMRDVGLESTQSIELYDFMSCDDVTLLDVQTGGTFSDIFLLFRHSYSTKSSKLSSERDISSFSFPNKFLLDSRYPVSSSSSLEIVIVSSIGLKEIMQVKNVTA